MLNFSRVIEKDEELVFGYFPSGFYLFLKSLLPTFLIVCDSFFLWYLVRWGTVGLVILGATAVLSLLSLINLSLFARNNVLLITSKRVIIFKRFGFFNKKVTDYFYAEVQNLAYRFPNTVNKLFHYGDLRIDFKNGDMEIISFLPRPDKIEKQLIAIIKK
jgi:hypothetical protein